jgi:hypothetical protein
VSTYVEPADQVAIASVDHIVDRHTNIWAVSEVDKDGKKKEGKLYVVNGAVFWMSEGNVRGDRISLKRSLLET